MPGSAIKRSSRCRAAPLHLWGGPVQRPHSDRRAAAPFETLGRRIAVPRRALSHAIGIAPPGSQTGRRRTFVASGSDRCGRSRPLGCLSNRQTGTQTHTHRDADTFVQPPPPKTKPHVAFRLGLGRLSCDTMRFGSTNFSHLRTHVRGNGVALVSPCSRRRAAVHGRSCSAQGRASVVGGVSPADVAARSLRRRMCELAT